MSGSEHEKRTTAAAADLAGGISLVVNDDPRDPPSSHHGSNIPPISPRRSKELHPTFGRANLALGSPKHARDRSKSVGQFPSNYPPSVIGSGSGSLFHLSPYVASPSASPIIGEGARTFLPSSGMPPSVPNLEPGSQTRTAVDHAVQSERERTKAKEKKELTMTADELRAVLKRERNRMSHMAADLAVLKSAAVQSQLEAEVVEEGRINCLMRRVEAVQQEKGRIIVELEREEEMLTNTLQKKLDEVKQEKMMLEAQLEREHAEHADLQSQLVDVKKSKEETIAKSK